MASREVRGLELLRVSPGDDERGERALHFSAARGARIETSLVARRTRRSLPPFFFFSFFYFLPCFFFVFLSSVRHVRGIFYSRRTRFRGSRSPPPPAPSPPPFLQRSRFASYTRPCSTQQDSVFSHAFHVSLSPFRRLKMECDKLASEKMEIQRHYVMVSAIAAS